MECPLGWRLFFEQPAGPGLARAPLSEVSLHGSNQKNNHHDIPYFSLTQGGCEGEAVRPGGGVELPSSEQPRTGGGPLAARGPAGVWVAVFRRSALSLAGHLSAHFVQWTVASVSRVGHSPRRGSVSALGAWREGPKELSAERRPAGRSKANPAMARPEGKRPPALSTFDRSAKKHLQADEHQSHEGNETHQPD